MEYKYTGIILNKKDIAETDRIYTMYTLEGGKIRSVAKGVRKAQAKLAPSLENITLADITIVRSRGLGKITGSIVENNFTSIKRNGEALLDIFVAFQLFDKLVDFENPDKEVFFLLKNYLEALDGIPNIDAAGLLIARYGFIVKLLELSGYAIGVDGCISCGEKLDPLEISFSSKQGGALCRACGKIERNTIVIKANAVKMLRIFLKNDIKTFSKIKASQEDVDSMRIAVEDFLRWNT